MATIDLTTQQNSCITGEPEAKAANVRALVFINLAHGLDHFSLLIFPTAVIALAAKGMGDYGSLISLSTGAFVAFGVLSLPVGFFANKIGRRTMMAVFFFGIGFSCLGTATASSQQSFFWWLLVLGCFAGIYHPVGSSLLIDYANPERLGRALGVNGVWGNLGTAAAPIFTAFLVTSFGWQAAFLAPAGFSILLGVAYVLFAPPEPRPHKKGQAIAPDERPRRLFVLMGAFVVVAACGGMTFNMLTVTLPKLLDERLGLALPLWIVGSLSTIVLICGAISQLNMGRLIEVVPLPRLLALLASLQPIGFAIAYFSTGVPLLIGLLFTVIAIYGNVVVIDGIVARYVPSGLRAKIYGVRYFVTFAVSGLAVPITGYLHEAGGFSLVLGLAFLFGLGLFLGTLVTWRYMEAPIKRLSE